MGPKQQNNAMVDEIKALIDMNFEELSKTIDTLQDKIDANHNALQSALEKTDQKAIDQSTENQEELKHLKFGFDDHEERYNKQQNLLSQLEEEIEDFKNRSLRITHIFRNISKTQNEKSWEDTKETLANQILKVIPDFWENEVYYNIERAQRQPLNQNSKSKYKTPVIIAKFANWSLSEKVKSGFIEASRKGDTQTMVSQMYSKKLNERRDKALEYRKEMKQKNPTVQAYILNIQRY